MSLLLIRPKKQKSDILVETGKVCTDAVRVRIVDYLCTIRSAFSASYCKADVLSVARIRKLIRRVTSNMQ